MRVQSNPLTSYSSAYQRGLEEGLAKVRRFQLESAGIAGSPAQDSGRSLDASESRAIGGVVAERERVEAEKYRFSPDLQREVAEKNRDNANRGKPQIDLAVVTREVDSIMNDPSLTHEQREKRLDAIKKAYDLSRGEMKDFFTHRLRDIHEASAERLSKLRETIDDSLDDRIDRAEASFGKGSPEVVALKQMRERSKAMFDGEIQRNEKIAEECDSFYPSFWKSLGKGLKSFFGGIGSLIDTVMPFVRMIPGVGQVAGAIWGGLKSVGSLLNGDLAGAAGALTEAIPGVGGFLGKAAAWGKNLFGGAPGRILDLATRVAELPGRALDFGKGIVDAAWNRVLDFGREHVGGIVQPLESFLSRARGWWEAAR